MTAKLGFRKWIELELHKKKVLEATGSGEFPDRVFDCLSVASSVNKREPWQSTVLSLTKLFSDSTPNPDLPLVKYAPKEDGRSDGWDYEGRKWAMWANLLCKSYGWSLEYVAEVDFNEVLALVQEILTDEQLEHEFHYSLSEVAYPYNKSTKKSLFKPMPRPYWMKTSTQPVKMMKMRKDVLPVGLIDDSGVPKEYRIRDVQNKTEKTDPAPSP